MSTFYIFSTKELVEGNVTEFPYYALSGYMTDVDAFLAEYPDAEIINSVPQTNPLQIRALETVVVSSLRHLAWLKAESLDPTWVYKIQSDGNLKPLKEKKLPDAYEITYSDDRVSGDEGADYIDALQGNDWLGGGKGDDRLIGNNGDDTVIGGSGNDLINGSAGVDRLLGGKGDDTLESGSHDLWYPAGVQPGDFETLLGGKGNDLLRGDDLADLLKGGSGTDSLFAMGEDDTIKGGSGRDNLGGGVGDDHLMGGKGSDTLDGGAGDDTLEGGPGSDEFQFYTGSGHDVIADFQPGRDRLVGFYDPFIDFGNFVMTRRGQDTVISFPDSDALSITIEGAWPGQLAGEDIFG